MMAGAATPLHAQCADGTPPPCSRGVSPNSVAVLAFRSVTHDTGFSYLSEGLSDEIATSLSGVARLEVRSPGVVRSTQQGGDTDPRALGRRLNVRYVVEGEYQRGGDRIRIAVRLVAVATGTQRWSSAWTRPTTDLLAVQEEVAQQVAANIAGQLLPAERTALSSGTANPRAWDRFLRGHFALRRRQLGDAIANYRAALALDSAFTRAWARTAYAYGLLLDRDETIDSLPAESLLARGTRAVDQALAADARSSDAWLARAKLAEVQDPLRFTGAREAYERAVALDPRNEEAWHQYGSMLAYLGQDSAAMAAWARVLELDPHRPQTLAEIARLDFFRRRFADLPAICRDIDVQAMTSGECALARAAAGDTAGALAELDSLDRWHGHMHTGLRARILGRNLDTTDAGFRALVNEPTRSCAQVANTQGPAWLAVGRPETALRLLAACRPAGPRVWFFMRSPLWDAVRAMPEFQRIWKANRPAGSEVTQN